MKIYKCEICGRENKKKIKLGGYILCSKHMHQLQKYGKFLDNIPRTNNDLNDYEILGKITKFNVYNQKNLLICSFIIDTKFIEKVKYHKWRYSHNHIVTGLSAKHTLKDLSWVILDLSNDFIQNNHVVVDHINGIALDNRISNLRICKQSDNLLNKSFMSTNASGFIGVSYRKDRNYYDAEIRANNKRCHLMRAKDFKEAVYARYYAEKLVFKSFANQQEQKRKRNFTKDIPQEKKKEIEKRVKSKIIEKGLWQ